MRRPEPTLAERLSAAMRDHPEWGFRDLWAACGAPPEDEFGDLLVLLLHAAREMLPPDGS